MRTENVTNIATPKGKLGIVSLVKEEFAQLYLKEREREGGRERERVLCINSVRASDPTINYLPKVKLT